MWPFFISLHFCYSMLKTPFSGRFCYYFVTQKRAKNAILCACNGSFAEKP